MMRRMRTGVTQRPRWIAAFFALAVSACRTPGQKDVFVSAQANDACEVQWSDDPSQQRAALLRLRECATRIAVRVRRLREGPLPCGHYEIGANSVFCSTVFVEGPLLSMAAERMLEDVEHLSQFIKTDARDGTLVTSTVTRLAGQIGRLETRIRMLEEDLKDRRTCGPGVSCDCRKTSTCASWCELPDGAAKCVANFPAFTVPGTRDKLPAWRARLRRLKQDIGALVVDCRAADGACGELKTLVPLQQRSLEELRAQLAAIEHDLDLAGDATVLPGLGRRVVLFETLLDRTQLRMFSLFDLPMEAREQETPGPQREE